MVGEVNPTAETSMKGIPITFTNVNLLAERNLAVSSSSADSIDLQIKGARSDLGRITRDDIRITADMGTAQKGENEINIQVRVPDGIEVTRKSMNKLDLGTCTRNGTHPYVGDLLYTGLDIMLSELTSFF